MSPLFIYVTLGLVLLGVTGCGGDGRDVTAAKLEGSPTGTTNTRKAVGTTATHAEQTLGKLDRDRDGDNNDDDYDITRYGHVASVADRRAVIAAIERYHAATAVGDGVRACRLLSADLIRALAGDSSVAGSTGRGSCGNTVTRLLGQLGGHTDAGLASIDITVVRVEGVKAFALVRLPTEEERYMPLNREGVKWKIGTVFDLGMI